MVKKKKRCVIINAENFKKYMGLQDSFSPLAVKGIQILGPCFPIST
jgi:hypothetical protein